MTNALLDPMPDVELMGNVLDMGRPELATVMARYAPKKVEATPCLVNPPTALIVTRWDGQDAPLRSALEQDGWAVKTCAGPAARLCPVMQGQDCPLRKSVDAAVVFVDKKERMDTAGLIPRLRCAADSASPSVIVVEGGFDAPNFGKTNAVVGALRGPEAILRALTALFGVRKFDGETNPDQLELFRRSD